MTGFFAEGIMHITDLEGYDHMLFLVAICAPYTLKNWKPLFLMATAFTLGHSLSLGLAALNIIGFSSDVIETLIPLTIMVTSVFNLRSSIRMTEVAGWSVYITTAIFGLIHGLGFSSYFRMIADDSGSVIKGLFLFNLGVEAGQLLIISVYLLITAILLKTAIVAQKKLAVFMSVLTLLVSCYLFAEKIFGS